MQEQKICEKNEKYCIEPKTLCDGTGREHTKCGNFCTSPVEKFPFFNKTTNGCNDKFHGYTHICGLRPGAKHQNNQCVRTSKIRQEYHCLNRMDVSEEDIAKISVSKIHTTSFNYFKLFTHQNDTHIFCDGGNMEKSCPKSPFNKKYVSCLKSSNKTELLSNWDICKDIAFITAQNYSRADIEGFKKIWLFKKPKENSSVSCPFKGYSFYCNETQACIGKEQVCDGRIQCFPGGEDEKVELCKSKGAFPKEANFICNETHRLVVVPNIFSDL